MARAASSCRHGVPTFIVGCSKGDHSIFAGFLSPPAAAPRIFENEQPLGVASEKTNHTSIPLRQAYAREKRGDGILCPVPEPEHATVGGCYQRALESLSQVGVDRFLIDLSPRFPPWHASASCPWVATQLTPHSRLSRLSRRRRSRRRRSRRRLIALFILRLRLWGRQPRRATRRRPRTRSSHPHHKSLMCIAWSTRRKTPTPV
jgi:hypothetical protein